MQDYQKRVINEKEKNDERLKKLNSFFEDDLFKTVDPEEQGRLSKQAGIMQSLSDILGERISNFK